MKSITIKQDITMAEIKKINISNELMGTHLVQSPDESIHITADLYISTSGNVDEITADSFMDVNTDDESGIVSIDITEIEDEDDDVDISHRSVLTISIPAQVIVTAETDNHFIVAAEMTNDFVLSSENGSLNLRDCTGKFQLTNENGSIKLMNIQGEIAIEQENGSVSSDNAEGTSLTISCENGSVKMRDAFFTSVEIKNENGNVFYESLPMGTGNIGIINENGNIHLSLAPSQGFKLEAKTEMGQITNNFMGATQYAMGGYEFAMGDESIKIELSTENGAIKISSSDMMGGDYLKGKLERIKDLLKDNSETGIQEAKKLINQLIASLTKMMDSVTEEAAKEKIHQALEYLNSWKEKINDPEIKTKVKESIDLASQEINGAMQDAMKAAQEAIKIAQIKFKSEFKPEFEKRLTKGKEFIKHFREFHIPPVPPVPPVRPGYPEQEAMQEKARMKILEMLEAGKITSDEAEKLLKAIH